MFVLSLKIIIKDNILFNTMLKVTKQVNRRLWGTASTFKKMIVLNFLNVVEAGVKAAAPFVFLIALEELYKYDEDHDHDRHINYDELYPIGAMMLFTACWGTGQVLPAIRRKLTVDIKSSLSTRLTSELMQVTASKALDYHQITPTGAISQSIFNTYNVGSNYVPAIYMNIVPASLEIGATSFVIAYVVNWKLGLSVLTTTGVYALISYLTSRKIPQLEILKAEKRKDMSSTLLSVFSNYDLMHYFNNEEHELSRVSSTLTQYKMILDINENALANAEMGSNFWILIAYLAIFGFAVHEYLTDDLEIDHMLVLFLSLFQMNTSLNVFKNGFNQLTTAIAELNKCIDMIDAGPDFFDAPHAQPLVIGDTASIAFQNVTLHDEKDGHIILDDVSFKIAEGKNVAFVGVSGSGKSTISKLLFRLIKPSAGKILINDQDISQCTIASVRNAIGIVPQESFLFNDTLRNNVRYGNLSVEEDETIMQALYLAGLESNLRSGKLTLDSILGEKGNKLSGGEKQRTAIARFLLKDPRINILDEPTAALDIDNRSQIALTLRNLAFGYTTILVTHELSLAVNVDYIFVFRKGKIVESGNFDELLATRYDPHEKMKKGYFFKMFKKYCDELGQPIDAIASSIPRVMPERRRPHFFLTKPILQTEIVEDKHDEQDPLLGRITR